MAAVEMLSEGERTISRPDWAAVADAIHRVIGGQSMSVLLEGTHDAWLSVSHVDGFGVQVMAVEDGQLGEKVLIDPAAEVKIVAVNIAGLPQEEPLSTLVAGALALAAGKHFVETGKRSSEFVWRNPLEVEREAIGIR